MGYIMELRKVVGQRPLIMVGSCVIVLDHNKILLQLRKDNQCWGLPGGSMEIGETLEEVAKRELFEETGLIAKELALFQTFSGPGFYYKYPNGDEVFNVVCAFVCKDYEGTLKKEEEEVLDLGFFNINQLPSKLSPPDMQVIHSFLNSI